MTTGNKDYLGDIYEYNIVYQKKSCTMLEVVKDSNLVRVDFSLKAILREIKSYREISEFGNCRWKCEKSLETWSENAYEIFFAESLFL